MTHRRRHFTADYKPQVAWMVVDDGLKVADVCRDQNPGETAVRRRVCQLKPERRHNRKILDGGTVPSE